MQCLSLLFQIMVRTSLKVSNQINTKSSSGLFPALKAVLVEFPDLYFVLDQRGVILDFNVGNASSKLSNFHMKILGKSMKDIFSPKVGTQIDKTINRIIKSNSSEIIEFVIDIKRKTLILEAHLIPLIDKKIIMDINNVTEKKQAEKDLFQFAAIIESSKDAIVAKTLDGKVTSWNKGAEKIFGFSAKKIIGQHFCIFVPDDRLEEMLKIVEQVKKGKSVIDLETTRKRKDGKIIDISMTISPIVSKSGKVVGISSISRDITHRKQIEEKLRQSEAKFRRVVDSNMIGIVYWNANGSIFDANDAFLDIVGYSRDDLLSGKLNWKQMTPSKYRAKSNKVVSKLFQTGKVQQYEKEFICKDGSQVPVMIGAANFEELPDTGISFVLDLTKIKDLEKQRDMFLGVAGHELKSPLTSMKALVQIMERQFKKKEDLEALQYLSKINDKINITTKLINDLLDLTRIRSGKLEINKEVFEFDELVKDTVKDIQNTSKMHKIVLRGRTRKYIFADKTRITQVIINLLTNAVKYSPANDKIYVKISHANKNIQLLVQDFGHGIPKPDQKRLFEPFYQVLDHSSENVSGLGLGLFISASIIKRHGGSIWVESEEGMGSSFYASIPIKSPD